jgi:hypothetical protein
VIFDEIAYIRRIVDNSRLSPPIPLPKCLSLKAKESLTQGRNASCFIDGLCKSAGKAAHYHANPASSQVTVIGCMLEVLPGRQQHYL